VRGHVRRAQSRGIEGGSKKDANLCDGGYPGSNTRMPVTFSPGAVADEVVKFGVNVRQAIRQDFTRIFIQRGLLSIASCEQRAGKQLLDQAMFQAAFGLPEATRNWRAPSEIRSISPPAVRASCQVSPSTATVLERRRSA
jgi:hypothetical protein